MSGCRDIDQSYAAELVRKGIHLASMSIPVGYYLLEQATVLLILIPLTAAFLLTDVARLFLPGVRNVYHKLFGWILRSHERSDHAKRLNGATFVLISACLCIWLFPKAIAITAFSILIISDTVAALVGRKFGGRPFLGKSLEGTTAFLLSAVVVVALSPKIAYHPIEYVIGFVGALMGTFVEAVPVDIDDNLSIPLSIGATMWLLYHIFLPGLSDSSLNIHG